MSTTSPSIYNRTFWIAYAANLCLVAANALTFRFAEYVSWLGGSESTAGMIVSIGGLGAILGRLSLGKGIDKYGVRPLWLLSGLLFCAGGLSFVLVDNMSWVLYFGRISFASGLAGMFTCSIVHIQAQVPTHRRTEIIGSLGSSGFLGIICGSQLGDLFLSHFSGDALFNALFGTSLGFGVLYIMLTMFLTRNDQQHESRCTPSARRLMVQYWPGAIIVVALVMGLNFAVTTVFLTRHATQLGLKGVGTFFTMYAITAFTIRILSRRWSETVGRHRMVLMGLTSMSLGMSLLPFISAEWHYRIPAMCAGFGHALLFPAVVSLGSGTFPKAYRGTGTTVVLGFIELGQMISAPLLGLIIDVAGFAVCFDAALACMVGTFAFYALTAARKPIRESDDESIEPVPCSDDAVMRRSEPITSRVEAASVTG